MGAAAALGGVVGLERERVEPAAGLRTHALVAVGSALLMIVSMFGFSDAIRAPEIVLDPSRVAAQIVSGIGFLGAGVIIFRREIIRGLTTAASVWVVAAIGMATGGGLFAAALASTVLSLAILAVMKPLEKKIAARRRPGLIRVVIDVDRTAPQTVARRLEELGVSVASMDVRVDSQAARARLDVVVKRPTTDLMLSAVNSLAAENGVREVRSSVQLSGLVTDASHPPRAERRGRDVVPATILRSLRSQPKLQEQSVQLGSCCRIGHFRQMGRLCCGDQNIHEALVLARVVVEATTRG